MTDHQRYEDLRGKQRLLKADIAHLSQRLDEFASALNLPVGSAAVEPPEPPEPARDAACAADADPWCDPDPTALVTRRPTEAAPVASAAWQQMPAALAAHAWPALADWVDELIGRYELHEQLPPCWYRHGAIVEELHALHLAWYGAYLAPHAASTDPAFWHDHLDRALTRIRGWDIRGCASGQHRDAPPPPADPRIAVDRASYIAADLRQRDQPDHDHDRAGANR